MSSSIGVHEGQIYVQRSQDTDKRNTNPYDVFTENEKVTIIEQPGLQNWRPLVASSPSRTPAMVNDKSLSILNQMDYPFGMSVRSRSPIQGRVHLITSI